MLLSQVFGGQARRNSKQCHLARRSLDGLRRSLARIPPAFWFRESYDTLGVVRRARLRRGVDDGGPGPGAPARPRRLARRPQTFQPPQTFQKYCFECHGGAKRKGDISIERLIRQSAQSSVGEYWDEWNKVAEMLETRQMPPQDKADCSRPTTSARRRWRGSGRRCARMRPSTPAIPDA